MPGAILQAWRQAKSGSDRAAAPSTLLTRSNALLGMEKAALETHESAFPGRLLVFSMPREPVYTSLQMSAINKIFFCFSGWKWRDGLELAK